MIERMEKIEDELNIIKYKFDLLDQFFKSDSEKTEAMKLFVKNSKDFMLETNNKLNDLVETIAQQNKTIEILNETIDSQRRSIQLIMEIIS